MVKGNTPKIIYVNPIDYADIRKFGRDDLDVISDVSLLKQGFMAELWGAEIRIGKSKPGEIKFEDDCGIIRLVCLNCKLQFDGESCPSELCVIRHVLDT